MSKYPAATQEVNLHCHPSSSCIAVSDVRVSLQRMSATQLRLTYRVLGELSAIRIPAVARPERCDGLWQHTCAEVFVAEPDHDEYVEFNLSPSTCWAAYEFSGYRQQMQAAVCDAPQVAVAQSEQGLTLEAWVELPARLAAAGALQASVTMVIEAAAGRFSYWAAQHATAKPDFHCRQSFVLTI